MQFTFSRFILLPLIALVVAVLLVVRVRRRLKTPIAGTFAVLMSAIAWWSLSVAIEYASGGLAAKVFWMKMSYFGIVLVPVAWLVFTLRYADRVQRLTPRNLALLSVVAVVTLAMVWTNDSHHLMWRDIWLDSGFVPAVDAVTHGAWFWIQAGYSYLLVLMGTVTLLSVYLHGSTVYREQVGVLLVASTVPWLANIAYVTGLGPSQPVDPTPLAFAVTGAAFSWGLFRLHLLDIMPVAHEAVFTSMVDGVVVLDIQGRIVDLNPAAQRVIGRERSRTVGQSFKLMLPAAAGLVEPGPDAAESQCVMALGEAENRRYHILSSSRIMTKGRCSGHLVLLHDDTARVRVEADSRERVRLAAELTEREKAEETLRASEARYRNLVENAAIGIIVCLPDGTILSANRAALEVFGFESEDEMRKTSVAERYADLRDRQRLFMSFETAGVARGFELRMKRRSGAQFWASLNVITQTGESGERRHLALIEDVTGRKQAEAAMIKSEAKFRSLFEQSMDAIYIGTPEGKVTDVNPAWLKLFGYTREDLPTLNASTLYADPADRETFARRMLETGFVEDEVRYRKKDGTVFDCQRTQAAIRDKSGRVIAFQGVNRDVTERKRGERELAESREELRLLARRVEQAREEERTTIARELHDQVGQTFTALKLDIARLRQTLEHVRPEIVPLLDGMEAMAVAGTNDVRRISSELRPGALDDLGLAGAIGWQLDQLRQRTSIDFAFERGEVACDLDTGQTTALFRVFQELVTNVVRHAGAKTVRVSLGHEAGVCVLTVADDGRGIDAEHINDRHSLGIVGMRERLLPYGGELHFQSAPGRGTEVRVTLPSA